MSNQNTRNAVARLEPVRMALPDRIREQYDLNEDSWRALVEAIFPNAKTPGAVLMALAYCSKNNLDIFQRVVHIVPMWNGDRMVETVWPGIAQLRITAQRQDDFGGYDDCLFGEDVTQKFKGKGRKSGGGTYDLHAEVTFPEWAQFIVYKMIGGERVKLPGPKVWFREAFSNKATASGECPNEMWQRRPRGQLEKCAEAAALRRAFPDVLGNEYAMEEMEGRDLRQAPIEGTYSEVTNGREDATPKSKPKRSDYEDKAEIARDDDARAAPDDDNPLDTTMVPSDAEAWGEYEQLVEARLGLFALPSEVLTFKRDEKWRYDQAPPEVLDRVMGMIEENLIRTEPPEENGETDEERT